MSSTQVTAIYIRSFYLNGQLEGDLDRAEALAGRILKMCVAMGGSSDRGARIRCREESLSSRHV
jgi:hypothetical protein